MGASVCLCFLNFIRLPNLQVATHLLCLAFLYDIFFVFITPYLFGSSVMMRVAEGAEKDNHNDPNFCEKYPNDNDCRDSSAPNLLVVPSINDYRGGEFVLPSDGIAFCRCLTLVRTHTHTHQVLVCSD
jgi:Signal peptide peptidase